MSNAVEFYDVVRPGEHVVKQLRLEAKGVEPGMRPDNSDAANLVLNGQVQYNDAMGGLHTDRFCLRDLPGGNSFTLDGGAEYNWRNTEYPEKSG